MAPAAKHMSAKHRGLPQSDAAWKREGQMEDGDVTCYTCRIIFPNRVMLARHWDLSALHNPHKICAKCSEACGDETSLLIHRGRQYPRCEASKRPRHQTCVPCRCIFQTEEELSQHLNSKFHDDTVARWDVLERRWDVPAADLKTWGQ
ncbi:hypothetical protein BZA05DRAFT_418414 [Tricharina praecox]|uniref:uncharacterized protein n=1 Tax=Tricharina praecox TaxID=43433 RepID=UPI002220965D|nr:uncharacterized protein BZA05DRAFT_418414 [Tricharina praecox]KAI5852089.1 hypothetical protein BZA05DRAFT_418414 [Tricharina praecox]